MKKIIIAVSFLTCFSIATQPAIIFQQKMLTMHSYERTVRTFLKNQPNEKETIDKLKKPNLKVSNYTIVWDRQKPRGYHDLRLPVLFAETYIRNVLDNLDSDDIMKNYPQENLPLRGV